MADQKSRIEELAAQNLKVVLTNPCIAWDEMVSAKMAADNCSRSVAVDRCLAQLGGSTTWQACCTWDAQQAKTVVQNGVPVRSGNWGNQGTGGAARRIPRAP